MSLVRLKNKIKKKKKEKKETEAVNMKNGVLYSAVINIAALQLNSSLQSILGWLWKSGKSDGRIDVAMKHLREMMKMES